jgi:hypothetical protein
MAKRNKEYGYVSPEESVEEVEETIDRTGAKRTYMPTIYRSGRAETILDQSGNPIINENTGQVEKGYDYKFNQTPFKKKKPVVYKPVYQGRILTKDRVIPGGNIE